MLKKTKNILNNNKYILISGGASLFIILLVYFCYEIIPFGDRTVYRMDLYHQYGPLFSELYDRLTSGESLLYSWNSGLGSSFLGNFYNYLSSPISFIILFFGHKNTFEAIGAMIAIKCMFSAMSMTYYIKKSQKFNSLFGSAFGILYAFSGYFIAYYWNVMWIDALYVLPFVVLGIEKIIDSGKTKTYFFALILAIFSNYYIGYMTCIFSCIYFIYYYVCSSDTIKQKKKLLPNNKMFIDKLANSFFLRSGFKFAFASFGAVIALLFMLVPLANVLQSSSATAGSAPTETKFYFNLYDFIANHLASLEPTIRSSGEDVLPNIYCGILTVILIPLYMFSNKINATEKAASSVLLAIMYFSFSFNYLNFGWHGFHFPNDLPYRQSFMYSFILIVLAVKAFKSINEFNKKQILGIGIAIIAFIVITQKLGSKNVTDMTVYISIVFVFLYTIILGLIVSKKNQVFALSVMLICSVAAESIVANTDHYVANQTKESFVSDYDDFKAIQTEIDETDDSLFYREELTKLRARMDPSWYDYNGASIFSSMAYEKVANLQKYIGLYGNKINSFTYNPQTPVYNAMFGIKYLYDKNDYIAENKYYSKISSNETYTAYENNYSLSLAYPVSSDVLSWNASLLNDPVVVQEEFFKAATGIEGVYNRIYDYDITYGNILSLDRDIVDSGSFVMNKISDEYAGSITIDITPKTSENVYIYVYSRNLDTVSVYSPKLSNTMSVNDGYILDVGYYENSETISVELPLKEDVNFANVDFIVFSVNHEKFVEGYEKLSDGQLEYTLFDETKIEGNFTANENEILFTTIPYDKGWNVFIDGNKVSEDDIVVISEALLGIQVEAGEHQISFVYEPVGFNASIIISSGFIIALLIMYVLRNKKLLFFSKKRLSLWDKTNINIQETEANTTEEYVVKFKDDIENQNNNE